MLIAQEQIPPDFQSTCGKPYSYIPNKALLVIWDIAYWFAQVLCPSRRQPSESERKPKREEPLQLGMRASFRPDCAWMLHCDEGVRTNLLALLRS